MRRSRTPPYVRAALVLVALFVTATPVAARAREQPLSSTTPSQAVQRSVDGLAAWVSKRGGKLSASVVNVETGAVVAEHEPGLSLNPASNMKILTAAAALDVLGPAFAFKTELHGHIENGRIAPLVLRGFGDPSLTTASLWRLARSLALRGVRAVDEVLVDQSHFDDEFVPPAFGQQPNEWAAFRAPVSAVAINGNTATLNVLPGKVGAPARVWFDPPGFVEIEGEVLTKDRGAGNGVRLTMVPRGMRLVAKIGGHVGADHSRIRFRRRLDDPRLAPGFVLAELLRSEGIAVSGNVALGGEGIKSRLTYVESPPLAVLVRRLGKASDNFYAESLLKVLGAHSSVPASSNAGAKAVHDFLARRGGATNGIKITNGSGLFDANRLSAQALTHVLRTAYRDPKIGPDFVAQLAFGGVDGTLKRRLGSNLNGHVVRAKTGTLNRAIALSGYVLSPSGGEPIAFSFLVVGIAGAHATIRSRIDAVVRSVATEQP